MKKTRLIKYYFLFIVIIYHLPLYPQIINSENYLGYQPVDPVPVLKVMIIDTTDKANIEKEIYWACISDVRQKRELLPIQSAQVSLTKSDISGKIGYLGSSISAEKGSYCVTMDYMKYRIENIYDNNGEYIGNGRVGIGLRIKADVVTTKSNLNIGSLSALGLEAKYGHLRGGISVDIIGIDSEDITNLIPLTSEIDQTSIQSSLQALASIKTKIWENETTLTPHLVAISQARPNMERNIRNQISTYKKTENSEIIRNFWKPDGTIINSENEIKLKDWMELNGLVTDAGSITMFLGGIEFEELRKKAVNDLKLKSN